jgi:hypothetical protein
MKIAYNPPYDAKWGASLSPWQRGALATLHRQGRHLPDRTDHNGDWRWCQAGCKTRDGYGKWRRSRPNRYNHEGVIVTRTDYGFTITLIRREQTFLVDPQTAVVTQQDGWMIVSVWHVEEEKSANYAPGSRPKLRSRNARTELGKRIERKAQRNARTI